MIFYYFLDDRKFLDSLRMTVDGNVSYQSIQRQNKLESYKRQMNEDRANLLRKKQKTTRDHQYVVSNNIDNNVLNTGSIFDDTDEYSLNIPKIPGEHILVIKKTREVKTVMYVFFSMKFCCSVTHGKH